MVDLPLTKLTKNNEQPKLDLSSFDFQCILENSAFWDALKVKLSVYSNFHVCSKDTVLAIDFVNVRSVCKEWCKLVPPTKRAVFVVGDLFYISRKDAELRFGLTQHKMKDIVSPPFLYADPKTGEPLQRNQHDFIKIADILPIFYKYFNNKLYLSLKIKREKKRKHIEIRETKFLAREQRMQECKENEKHRLVGQGMP